MTKSDTNNLLNLADKLKADLERRGACTDKNRKEIEAFKSLVISNAQSQRGSIDTITT